MTVNLLKEGEKLTDFGWGIARKKPIKIHYREVIPNADEMDGDYNEHPYEQIYTREGTLKGYPDKDFVIKGVRGEIYPIGKDIFYESYDVIEEPHTSNQTAKTEVE